jgi:hypothetical protein
MLLDRAFGKAPQMITGPDGNAVTFLHLVAMREIGELVTGSAVIDGQANDSTMVAPPAELADLGAPAPE